MPAESILKKAQGSYDALPRFGGNTQQWAVATVDRIRSWGFNTAAAWCDEEIYKQPIPCARVIWFGNDSPSGNRLVDVFSADYAALIEGTAAKDVEPHRNDAWLIGYFINNELPWYGEFGWATDPEKSLFNQYFALPPGAPGRRELFRFLHERYSSVEKLKADWNTSAADWEELEKEAHLTGTTLTAHRVKFSWAGRVAERYFALCAEAIRRHDPNHLILGCRFATKPPRSVVEAIGNYADVVSINMYSKSGDLNLEYLRNVYALTRKPIMITEFSWRGMQNRSGDANTGGADVTVQTQQERADHYRRYVSHLLQEPYIVGMHWFQYVDQPPAGRYLDGENSNYGIVDIHDEPYEELTGAMQQTNARLPSLREGRVGTVPVAFDERSWNELMPIHVAAGKLAQPVILAAATSKAPLSLFELHADSSQGNQGAWERAPDAWIFHYQSARGWGVHGDIPLEEILPAGAANVEVELQAPSGLQMQVFLQETGDGPTGLQVYQGKNGADGESFELPQFAATGTRQVVRFNLNDCVRRVYWGNQGGNLTVDTQGLRSLSIYLHAGQGSGDVRIYAVSFTS